MVAHRRTAVRVPDEAPAAAVPTARLAAYKKSDARQGPGIRRDLARARPDPFVPDLAMARVWAPLSKLLWGRFSDVFQSEPYDQLRYYAQSALKESWFSR